ncbi:MAG TPA: hypothetical protein DEO32_03220 [Ruminococcaceae bacterium]|nr:hypothetical protein [Oscillospiraceae bacterium]
MKKIIAFAAASIIAAAAFTGCGQNAGSTVSQVASDAASGAGEVAKDVGDGVSNAVTQPSTEAQSSKNNGEVSDTDGFVGEEETTKEAAETTVSASDVSE